MPDYKQKVAENRVRRLAERRGYLVRKSRVRDKGALTYGMWQVVFDDDDEYPPILTRSRFGGDNWWLPLHELEDWLRDSPNAAELHQMRITRNGKVGGVYEGYKGDAMC